MKKSQLEITKQAHTANIDNQIQLLNQELARITDMKYLLQNPIHPQAMIHAFDVQCSPRQQELTLYISTLKLSKKEYDDHIKKARLKLSDSKNKLKHRMKFLFNGGKQ